jgi:hypothetical protein
MRTIMGALSHVWPMIPWLSVAHAFLRGWQ